MSYTRTFQDFGPPPRYDGDPYTQVVIAESESRGGPWATVETLSITPAENPAEPPLYSFTTDLAALEEGYYRLTWKDASGDVFVGSEFWVGAAPDWTPSIVDVAALLRARTKMLGGRQNVDGEAGTFNDLTRPTGTEVERLITQAVRRVASQVTTEPCNENLKTDARYCAALFAAMLIEQSYWPEQTNAVGSAFKNLESMFDKAILALENAVKANCGGGEEGEEELPGDAGPAGGYDDGYLLYGRDWPPCGGF